MTPQGLSDKIKSIRMLDNAISTEEFRIRYATERFLARVQQSGYRENLVIKGGFLMGILFDVGQRTTMDLDSVIEEMAADQESIQNMITSIIESNLHDGVTFAFKGLDHTQEQHTYPGYRVKLTMNFNDSQTIINFSLDLGVGDRITPSAKDLEIPLVFKESTDDSMYLTLKTYPIETTLAEKTETIINLNNDTTRMKDFYDVYLILNNRNGIDNNTLYNAFKNTWETRHKEQTIELEIFDDWLFVADEILENTEMEKRWYNYGENRPYINNLTLNDVLQTYKEYIELLRDVYEAKNR